MIDIEEQSPPQFQRAFHCFRCRLSAGILIRGDMKGVILKGYKYHVPSKMIGIGCWYMNPESAYRIVVP